MALDPSIAISLVGGLPPIWTRLIRYYSDQLVPTWGSRARGALSTLFRTAVVVFLASLLAVLVTAGLTNKTPAQPMWRR